MSAGEVDSTVEYVGGVEVVRLRDGLLPLVRLDGVLGLACGSVQGFYVAVVEAGGFRYGLVVDDLVGPEEIVVKPLSMTLREIGVFSGAAVLGCGELAMIVDLAAIARRAGVRPMEARFAKQTTAAGEMETAA